MRKTTILSIFFLILILVLLSSLLIRDISNVTYSYIGDEYAFYDLAKGIANETVKNYSILSANGVYGHVPMLDSVYQASIMRLFGVNLFGWKMSSIIVVLISSILVFLIGTTLFHNVLVGVSSAVFFSFSHYLISFAHIPYNNLHSLIFFLLAILFFLLSHNSKKHTLIYIFLCGLISGFSFYTFLTARLVILLIIPFIVSGKKFFQKIIIYLAGLAIPFIPFWAVNQDQVFFQMSRRYFGDPDFKGLNFIGIQNFFLGLFFEKYIPINHYFIGPILTYILAGAFLCGCYFFLKKRAKKSFQMFFLLFWVLIIQILITIGNVNFEVPNTRLHVILPSLCLIAGFGIVSVVRKPLFIFVLLTVYIIFQIYFFYYVTPRKYPIHPLSLLLRLAKENQTKEICAITDEPKNFYFSYDQVKFLSNLYNQQNVLPIKYDDTEGKRYTCNLIVYINKNDYPVTASSLQKRTQNKQLKIYTDQAKINYIYYYQ